MVRRARGSGSASSSARAPAGEGSAPRSQDKVPPPRSASRPPAKPFPVLPRLGASDVAGKPHTTPTGCDASRPPPPSPSSFSMAREKSRARSRPSSAPEEGPRPPKAGGAGVGWVPVGSRLCGWASRAAKTPSPTGVLLPGTPDCPRTRSRPGAARAERRRPELAGSGPTPTPGWV